MAHMDVFNSDAFTMQSLTNALEHIPYVPRRLGELGLFTPRPIMTEGFTVEEHAKTLKIVPTSLRGQDLESKPRNEDRMMRYLKTPRIAEQDTVYASEVQNWREFGTEDQLQSVQREISRRMGSEDGSEGLRANLELTREYHRLGAIQGLVMDADGTTELYNWYTVFNITAEPIVNFAWPTAATDEGAIRVLCNEIRRTMQRNARGAWVGMQTRVRAICGDNFFDALTQNSETRGAYKSLGEITDLADRFGEFGTFTYGGITWENYRGTDDGSTVAIPTDECRFFPEGGSSVFQVVQSPAEFMPFVNTPGQAEYAVIIPDMKRQAFVKLELYAYPAYMCTRPKMLMSGRTQP